jgi:hypothetical protein
MTSAPTALEQKKKPFTVKVTRDDPGDAIVGPHGEVVEYDGADLVASFLYYHDAMCWAINICHRIDEVKDICDKARAVQVYFKQAMNLEAEWKVWQIRMRAMRRIGRLLKEMKVGGQRDPGGRGKRIESSATSQLPTLKDLGLTADFSSKCQRLDDIPDVEWERVLGGPRRDHKLSINGLLKGLTRDVVTAKTGEQVAILICHQVCDLENALIIRRDLGKIVKAMPGRLKRSLRLSLPPLIARLQELEAELAERAGAA